MEANLSEWLKLIARWIHIIAGISWIGSSFFFMWLDSHLAQPDLAKPEKKDVTGELWMVHSGGFYQVEKRLIGPGTMPKTLHWFKWEAAFTWISGIFLLGLIYYMNGGIYLIDPAVSKISAASATAMGIALLVISWFGYDYLWRTSLAARNSKVISAICFGVLVAISYGLCQVMSGRAAFMHVGAMLGTLMVANVWVRIIPFQKQMVDATQEGRKPDFDLGKQAKTRSIHNNYMTFPLIFIMLSNHFPNTYGHTYNWLLLTLIILMGAAVRHSMNVKNRSTPWMRLAAAVLFSVLFFMTNPTNPYPSEPTANALSTPTAVRVNPVSYREAKAIISRRCVACHSTKPTDSIFTVAPNGVTFDSAEKIKIMAARIKDRVVITRTMPLSNKTGITEEERSILGRWVDTGAQTD